MTLDSQKTREETYERLRVIIQGAVQGVGFRPFIYRLAGEMSLYFGRGASNRDELYYIFDGFELI